ncbi:SDR family oxidoreductase [Actinoplanes sp. NPDC051851]|uniref:SDR family NAD(P)-dependent oxidoreductase n=1 Tax=Actinoplanes sp. NPDC051851 TaxID=3154753 RepID=UPI003425E9AA
MTTTISGRFTGKTIIVTGAASGIGRATAVRVVDEGGRVVATDVNKAGLDSLAGEHDVSVIAGDLLEAATITSILAAAGDHIDGLANIAGIMDDFVPPGEVDDVAWDRVMGINITAPMRLTRAVLPRMIAAGRGAIINLASEASLRGSAAGAAYTASKHAVVGLTQNVAFFYGPQGIRANAVAPGPTITGMRPSMPSELAVERCVPVMRATMPPPVTAETMAASITWLLSDDAANVNGVVLPSDGGWAVA